MRKLGDWLDTFLVYSAPTPSPAIFRKWAGLAAISGVLRRNVSTTVRSLVTFPNIYAALVGPPGSGKTVALLNARPFVAAVPGVALGPNSLTEQGLYQLLEASGLNSMKHDAPVGEPVCTLTALINEFGTFIKGDAVGLLDALTDLFDCADPFRYVTKHDGDQILEKPALTMVGGGTPRWFKEVFTSGAFEKGFAARLVIVWSEEKIDVPLFPVEDLEDLSTFGLDKKLYAALEHDIKIIGSLKGQYTWDKAAREAFVTWVKGGMLPIPQDPKLEHYCNRRIIHVTKLSMLVTASRGNSFIITDKDFERAKSILLEAESTMGKVMEGLGENPLNRQMLDIKKLVELHFFRTKTGLPEYRLRAVLAGDVPVQHMDALIRGAVAARMVYTVGEAYGQRMFFPVNDTIAPQGASVGVHGPAIKGELFRRREGLGNT